MNKKELVISVLDSMGYKPKVDDEGDVFIRYQMKTFYFLSLESDDNYVAIQFPQFYPIEKGEEVKVLAACNKLTRDIRLVKVYVDHTFQSVGCNSEFYYGDEESLKLCIEKSIKVLEVVRSLFVKTLSGLDEQ